MPFSKTLLPEFDQEMKNTRKILECVPDGKFDYKPHPKSMSLREVATHVAGLPSWTNFTLELEELDLNPDFKQDVTNTRAELLAHPILGHHYAGDYVFQAGRPAEVAAAFREAMGTPPGK